MGDVGPGRCSKSNTFLFMLEGASVSSCDDTITTVESDTFKYFRTKFTTVANNKITVEVRDIQGKFFRHIPWININIITPRVLDDSHSVSKNI